MEYSPNSIENKIINATIECIEKFGIQGTTNRKIAAMAGVNSAAINYYFRSKDALIQRFMQATLDNAFNWKDFENLPGDTAKERCFAIFNDIVIGGCNYPGVTRAHFYELINEGNYNSLLVERIGDFIETLVKDLAARGSELEEDELRLACFEITSSALMMVLAPGIFKARFGFDMHDSEAREKYLRRLIDRLL